MPRAAAPCCEQYGELLAADPVYAERARRFSAKVRDVTEWLAELTIEPPPAVAPIRRHLPRRLPSGPRASRCASRRASLLRAIPGIELVDLPESEVCCGSAGSYNLTEPAMAARLRERKVRNIESTAADCVVTANPGCVLQIQAGLSRHGRGIPVLHPIEVLDRAYRACRWRAEHAESGR